MDDVRTALEMKASFILMFIEKEVFISPWPPRRPGTMMRSKPCENPYFSSEICRYIGGQIHTWRKMRKMTQLKLAMLVHLDESQVSRHEHGFGLTIDILPLYAEALDCDLSMLLPPGKKKIIYDERDERINRIIDRILDVSDLPPEQREEVIHIVESTLNLVLPRTKNVN